MFASHYVIKHIFVLFDKNDMDGSKELADKFVSRYPTDTELNDLRAELLALLKSEDKEQKEKLRKRFRVLISSRRIESAGGTSTFTKKSRRPGIDSWVRLV